MKPKQLANVLIKILGLSLIAHGIPGLINGAIGLFQYTSDNHLPLFTGTGGNYHYSLIVFLNLIPFAVGMALIVGSRWFVEKLFKDEAE